MQNINKLFYRTGKSDITKYEHSSDCKSCNSNHDSQHTAIYTRASIVQPIKQKSIGMATINANNIKTKGFDQVRMAIRSS